MDWNLSWILFGALAFLLALVALGRAVQGKERGGCYLLFGSLACGALALLEEYRMAVGWVQRGDWPALADVLPSMEGALTGALFLGLALNLAAAVLYERARREKTS